jgi:hypothetical protein
MSEWIAEFARCESPSFYSPQDMLTLGQGEHDEQKDGRYNF